MNIVLFGKAHIAWNLHGMISTIKPRCRILLTKTRAHGLRTGLLGLARLIVIISEGRQQNR